MTDRMRLPEGLSPRQMDFETLDMMGASDEQLGAFMTKAEIDEYHAYIQGKSESTQRAQPDILARLLELPDVPILAGVPPQERRQNRRRFVTEELRTAVHEMVEALRRQKDQGVVGRLRRLISIRGGPGSGHHGHEGRPGEVGGSLPEGTQLEEGVLYHGTTRAAAQRIRREGIARDRSTDGHVWAATTRDIAQIYGQMRTMRRPWALVVIDPAAVGRPSEVSDLDQGKFAWSEDIPPEAILRVEIWGWKRPSDTRESLLDTIGPRRAQARAIDLPDEVYAVITFSEDDYTVVNMGGEAKVTRGGPGSGHFAHEGRPGEVGGSQPSVGGKAEAAGAKAGLVGQRFLEGLRSVGLFRGQMTDQPETVRDAVRLMKEVMHQAETSWASDPRWIASHAQMTLQSALGTSRFADDEPDFESLADEAARTQVEDQAQENIRLAMQYIHDEAEKIGREAGNYERLREILSAELMDREISEEEWGDMGQEQIEDHIMLLAWQRAADGSDWHQQLGDLGTPDDDALRFSLETGGFPDLQEALHDRFYQEASDSVDRNEIMQGIRAEHATPGGALDESADMPEDIHLRTMEDESGMPVAVLLFTVQSTESGPPSEGIEEVRILAERAGDERFVMLDSLASGEQGQGLGKALAMEAIRYAAENNLGLGGMAVQSALSFYEQLGADVTGKTLEGNPLIYAPASRIREYYDALQGAIQATVEAGIQTESAIGGLLRRV